MKRKAKEFKLRRRYIEVSSTNQCIKKNLDILFETEVTDVEIENNKIKTIILKNDILSIPIDSTYFVDATGSGILSSLAGCKFIDDTIQNQQSSLRFILSNVDVKQKPVHIAKKGTAILQMISTKKKSKFAVIEKALNQFWIN